MGGSKHSVLIVDDSRTMRELLSDAVTAFPDIDVVEAGDGMTALAAVRAAEEPFALIIIDLNMPIMDGMKVLSALRDSSSAGMPPVVVVSTDHDAKTIAKVHELGALQYLEKPVTRQALQQILHIVLDTPAGE